ncbi:MAG: YncE family protein [Sphingomonas sp.]
MGKGRTAAAIAIATAALALTPALALAQVAVTVSDGKQAHGTDVPGAAPDTLSSIDLGGARPRILGTIRVANSLIGPPTSVAVTPDERLAIVTAAQALAPGKPPVLVLADVVSVIDLSNRAAPKLVQTLHAGPGATGVAINRAGTLALVASTGDDSISVYTIAGRRLKPVGRIQLPYQSRPTDVVFAPDGKSALVVSQTPGRVVKFAVEGVTLVRTDTAFSPGLLPYGIVVAPRGDFAFNSNLGGRIPAEGAPSSAGPRASTISVLDLNGGKVVDTIDVGAGSEHLTLSADGAYLAVTVGNGSNARVGSAEYHPFGLLKIFRVEGPKLTFVTEARTGQWCQGAAWTRDHRAILLQCAGEREIQVFGFDGAGLARDENATLRFDARPASIATAWSR